MSILRRATVALTTATLALALASTTAFAAPADKPANPTVHTVVPTLEARATLSADYSAPGPDSGALATPANGRQGPFEGQVIPGFSAMIENSDGTFWAMPDNGFGNKANSADFLLRLYQVQPAWETTDGGPGEIEVLSHVSLRDPNRLAGFTIVNRQVVGVRGRLGRLAGR